ncbi:hypothetical protein TKK_0010044 [Trichogramma kaykai]
MSQSHAQPRRGSSDFSIERILAKDDQSPASSTLPTRAFDAVMTSKLTAVAPALRCLQHFSHLQPVSASKVRINEPRETQQISSQILIHSVI